MINRKYLLELLANAPFGGSLNSVQVRAITLILDACESLKLPLQFIAYILATAFHETGGSMVPGKENLNYSVSALRGKFGRDRISLYDANRYGRIDGKQKANQKAIANLIYGGAWGLRELGNKLAGDGWKYIGRGFVQLTGRRNYEKFGLADDVERASNPEMAANIIVVGMTEGLFTGKKLSSYMLGQSFAPEAARAVVNGKDKASLIARHYDAIYQALLKAEVQEETASPELADKLSQTEDFKTSDVPATESAAAKGIYSTLATGVAGTLLASITTPWAAIALVALLAVGGVFLWGHLTGRFEFKRV